MSDIVTRLWSRIGELYFEVLDAVYRLYFAVFAKPDNGPEE